MTIRPPPAIATVAIGPDIPSIAKPIGTTEAHFAQRNQTGLDNFQVPLLPSSYAAALPATVKFRNLPFAE
jgi:hypothetical protein